MPLEDVLMFAMAVRAGGPQADERCGAGQSDVERSRVEMEWTWSGVKWSTVQSGRVCCAGWRPGGSISTSSSASPHRAQHRHIGLSIATSSSASPHRARVLSLHLPAEPSAGALHASSTQIGPRSVPPRSARSEPRTPDEPSLLLQHASSAPPPASSAPPHASSAPPPVAPP